MHECHVHADYPHEAYERALLGGGDGYRRNRPHNILQLDDLLDGDEHTLTIGDDFDCSFKMFKANVHRVAKMRGIAVRVLRDGDEVTVQAGDDLD